MKAPDRARLTTALRDHVAKIAADLRAKMRSPGASRVAAEQVHKDERVAEDFEVWTDLLSRRAAVLWVLKTVYVRVLEDRGLLVPGRLLDPEAQQLFEKLAPNLGDTAFLRWVYKDLASSRGGVPELFSPQPAEVALPSDDLSRALIAFWRHRDADSGAVWSFAEEHFEGELMGDLYQELDPVVKDRFALCQTPDFVRAFILDRTLTPAIETFGADEVRLLDPACGSGHFLIDGLKRIIAATASQHGDWDRAKVVAHALDRVVGVDINDYACALARTRLIMTAAELAGETKLADAARFHPHVYWADGLEQVEKEEQKPSLQLSLFEKVAERPRATLTRSDVRAALKKVFEKKFHAIVANPPYITEGDDARKRYHTEKVGRGPRYASAYKRYHLSGPFTERCFQLATADGFVGVIIDDSFMKRDHGRPLVERVLSSVDLSLVVNSSKAEIPHHGTPTVLVFGRNRRPSSPEVRAVLGRKSETPSPQDPAHGKVWVSILAGWNEVGFDNEYVSIVDLSRDVLGKHPWSLSGGGVGELKSRLEGRAAVRFGEQLAVAGFASFAGLDEPFYQPPGVLERLGYDASLIRPLLKGSSVRDWVIVPNGEALTPYDEDHELLPYSGALAQPSHLWCFRTSLRNVGSFAGSRESEDSRWWGWYRWIAVRYRASHRIVYAAQSTHNHFALERGDHVFNNKAPILILNQEKSEEDYLVTTAYLNSSSACFLMKQTFQPRSHSTQRHHPDPARAVFELAAGGLKQLPIPPLDGVRTALAQLSQSLERLAVEFRNALSPERVNTLVSEGGSVHDLRKLLSERWRNADQVRERMVALQEEIDWTIYHAYGLCDENCLVPLQRHEGLTCPRGQRPFERILGRQSTVRVRRQALSLPEAESAPVGAVPGWAESIWARRCDAIRENEDLGLLETPVFKRAWRDTDQNVAEPRYRAERDAEDLEAWLFSRMEGWARGKDKGFTLLQIGAALQGDRAVQLVAEVLTKRQDFSIDELLGSLLSRSSVPNQRFHVYTESGLAKRMAWEEVWAEQNREDAGRPNGALVQPPEFSQGSRGKSTDFLRTDYWRLRGRLDVRRERFISFTEVPGRSSAETLYGWAGWTAQQCVKAILAIDEELEDASVPLADRIGLLDSAWRLLPHVAREDAAAATRLKAELQALVGPEGTSSELIEDWKKRFPPQATRAARAKNSSPTRDDEDSDTEESDES